MIAGIAVLALGAGAVFGGDLAFSKERNPIRRSVAAVTGSSSNTNATTETALRTKEQAAAAAALAPAVAGCTAGADSDFNGDGISDVAIGDPDALVGRQARAGTVTIVYGGTGTVQVLSQGISGVPGGPEAGDQFGFALASYDANKDGCADLAVSAPFEGTTTDAAAGAVVVLYGAPTGLSTGSAGTFIEALGTGWEDHNDADDWFGYSLAAGNTPAGDPFVVMGVPGADISSAPGAGMALYLRNTTVVNLYSGHGISGVPEADDRVGFSVSASPYHVAVGSPGEALADVVWAGVVNVFTHDIVSGLLKQVAVVGENAAQIGNTPKANDNFGKSVSLAPYRAPGAAAGTVTSILAVGAPGTEVNGLSDAGLVHRFLVTATGATRIDSLSQASAGVADDIEDGDYFGDVVRLVNTKPGEVSTAQTVQLAVGSPGEDVGSVLDAGSVSVFAGAVTPVTPADVTVARRTGSIGGAPGFQELLGGYFGVSRTYLYVASPYRDGGKVFAVKWADLAQGLAVPAQTYTANAGGIPAGVSFGAAVA
ncbi:hypothetical protein Ahu01nite_082310 [Winogradskya humida]|uniref:FG-GAP repeat protein n=1 Tax=Winogradskya humida TaxID=113566 RepID=A0ABQ4A2R0_9ACTN|nr:hypothetical protein Ahu01nite_082310 [Actinoplanes humidus]